MAYSNCAPRREIKYFALLLSLFVGLVLTAPAFATTYTYTGNNFDSIRDTTAIGGQYNTSQSVQGSFDLAFTLPANQTSLDVSALVTSFSFTDGRQTFTDASTLSREFFNVSTDATGQISMWRVVLESTSNNPLDAIDTVNFGASVRDRGRQLITGGNFDQGSIQNAAGSWTVTNIPEPGTALLLGLGLVALSSERNRRR